MRQELGGRHSRIEQWGNSQILKGPWPFNQQKTVLQHKPFKSDRGNYCIPVAQSLLLSVSMVPAVGSAVGSNYALRWNLNVGGGGGAQRVVLDALNVQQLSLAAENVDVSVFFDKFDASQAYVAPDDLVVTAGVSFADGNVTNGKSTYTQGFTAPQGLSSLQVPFMATSMLIEGDDTNVNSPFVAGVSFQVGRAVWKGASLLPPFYGSNFLELPGNAVTLFIQNNNAQTAVGDVQWGLDL